MVVRIVYLVVSMVLAVTFSFSAFGAKNQPVYSLKKLADHQGPDGKVLKKVQVKCNAGSELRYIHQASGVNVWCVDGEPNQCSENRIDAATQACNIKQPSSIATLTPVRTATPVTLNVQDSAQELEAQAQRKKLEDELMENDQQKIVLRSKRLELKKRQLELQALQSNN